MFYNVWWTVNETWTARGIEGTQDWYNPPGLSKEAAESLCFRLNRNGTVGRYSVRQIIPSEIIPGIPMDPTMHPLMAGHLQDRARKRS